MARHKSFPRFLSSACVSLRRLRLNTNHNMEAIFRLLEGRCCSLSSLEVRVFVITINFFLLKFKFARILVRTKANTRDMNSAWKISQDLFRKKTILRNFLFTSISVAKSKLFRDCEYSLLMIYFRQGVTKRCRLSWLIAPSYSFSHI